MKTMVRLDAFIAVKYSLALIAVFAPLVERLGKQYIFKSSGGAVAGGTASISTMRTIYEKNKLAWILLVVITFGAPFLGLFVVGIPGLVIGLISGVISWFIGPKAVTKVVEHRHYN